MPHSTSLTPRSNSGSTPSVDTAQSCSLEAFTKLAAFISGAPWTTLSAIMSAGSEDQLKETLASVDLSDPQIQPSTSVTTTCQLIHKWLERYGQRSAASRDLIPLSLLLLLKFGVQNGATGALLKCNDSVRLVVALKIAFGNTSDSWMTLKPWEKQTGVLAELITKAEPLFLGVLDWGTWVQNDEFTDFVARLDMLWAIVFNKYES
ncbi:uncharacterized protein K460DRAFT_359247 [Cucurbitaria berberidis CBS 394.84]|uniref:Uncharacterized protein n=1 Tax=Cucurbitaria berberidis CBS 394.84 TaxID=1168544 RepID=A0A9P4L3U8_9PLEO|nr:uncharacterized protein K460DRAFT_359247 [Cucurbitaria berberidis CBS 394.84]KAF1840667.1 hypothetical protein K460DRAFT_359247 [Cucurbitaria berberidis CBS 394.84]